MGEAQIDAVGLRRRIRLRGLLVRELRELRRIEVAGAMPADVVGTMLRSAARHLCFDGLIRTYHIMGSNAASDGISECRAKSQTLSVHRAKQPVRGRHACCGRGGG